MARLGADGDGAIVHLIHVFELVRLLGRGLFPGADQRLVEMRRSLLPKLAHETRDLVLGHEGAVNALEL